MQQVECTVCEGLGSIELTGARCRYCGGSGWVPYAPKKPAARIDERTKNK